MKIAIVLTGRSHLLNVARSLIEQGHEVKFYTAIPKSRCEKFGLDRGSVVSFFFVLAPFFIYRKITFSYRLRCFILSILDMCMDFLASRFLQKCDVFIGASVVAVKSSRAARSKYNAHIVTDCGTKHVLSQDHVLSLIPGADRIYKAAVKNELKNYSFADTIIVASSHAKDSFIENGVAESKLFVNPYGVDLSKFPPTIKSESGEGYDVIITGAWRYIKGCDVLAHACLDILKVKLLHVGSVFGDCPLPKSPLFTHVDAVNEYKLSEYYAKAKIFVLPSRADGFGMVLLQAMASGLPVVYTYDTGGPDIRDLITNKGFMLMTPELTPESLAETISEALKKSEEQPDGQPRDYLKGDQEKFSWSAYGKRYSEFLESLNVE